MTIDKNLKEALFKQRIKKMHRALVQKILTEQEHSLYSTFIQPFTDVIDATKLSGQDILNTAKLSFDLLTTLSPKKMEAAIDKFDKRKAKIEEKWKPLMERTDQALANSDASIIALALAPGAFFATEAIAFGYEKADSLHSYLADSGWRIPFASTILGHPPEESSAGSSGGEGKSLLGKLAGLFYVENTWHKGDILTEQEDVVLKKEPNFKKAMKKYLDETGLSQQFEQSAKELIAMQKELLEEIIEDAIPRLELISALSKASSVDEFILAVEESEKKGLDLNASGMENMKQAIMDSAKKLTESDEFKNQVAEQAQKTVEELSQEELATAAKKVAFINAKQEFDKKLDSAKAQLKALVLEKIKETIPDENNIIMIKTSTLGLQYIKLIEDSKQKIQNS